MTHVTAKEYFTLGSIAKAVQDRKTKERWGGVFTLPSDDHEAVAQSFGKILDWAFRPNSDVEMIVLAQLWHKWPGTDNGGKEEYVVWWYNAATQGYYSGSYTKCLEEARRDYNYRSRK